ncbi:MAG: ABC transporter permease [Opitutaceae bacterium]
MKLLLKFRSLFQKQKLDADMTEEMRLHVERRTEENIAAGLSPEEARHAALRKFGGVEQAKEVAREQRGGRWLEELHADLRFALRVLRKHPGFTAAAVFTLALGTGFVTTLFTMINGVAFGQLPFEDAPRIVSIDVRSGQFDDYARLQQSCEAIALVQSTSANLRAGTFVSRYSAAVVSINFLEILRARPARGRGFQPADGRAGAPLTALIGHTMWERDFERSPDILGREIQINGEVHTIVGVMPEGFGFPLNQELWTPRRTAEPAGFGIVFGRLRPGVSARQASAQFTALARGLAPATGDVAPPTVAVQVIPYAERFVKPMLKFMLSAIMGATFLVLLLACANVANLILARAVGRRKELAVRAAMGASRARLVRQMLTETLVVAAAGAAGGLTIATWTTRLVWTYMMKERTLTGGAPFWMNFDVDGRVYAFVVVVALLASLLTGLVPALQASRVDLNDALKDGLGSGLRVSRFSRLLVNAQMAFSVCLVTVAGLFVTVLMAFNQKTLPYDPRSVLTARVSLDERRYDDGGARTRFYEQLVSRLQAAPGIEGAGLNSADSLRLARNPRIEIEGAVYPRPNDRPGCTMETVSNDLFEGLGVGLLAGRKFSTTDHATAPGVAVVNAAFATRFGAEREVVGRRFRLAGDGATMSPWITVVGVVPDLGSMKAGEVSRGPVIYRPLAQADERAMTILVRTRGDVARFAGAIRGEVAALDPELPVARFQTVQEIVEAERVGMNAFGTLFIVCGIGALALASVGIYGVISFAVKLRTREFGVRMALGADRGTITRMVFGQGARQVSVGLGAGVLLAVGASAVLSSMFVGFGRSAFDLWIYLAVVALLSGVGAAALLIPARRAAKVDPMVALRAE